MRICRQPRPCRMTAQSPEPAAAAGRHIRAHARQPPGRGQTFGRGGQRQDHQHALGPQPGQGQLKQIGPGHEGSAHDAVRRIILALEKMLHRTAKNMGGGQLQTGQGAGQKEGALFAHFHHIIAAPGPDHAQGNARQARTGTEIPGQRLFRQGQFLQKGGQMEAVGRQTGQNIPPGARAHQIHGRVPLAQHFQIDGQRLQSRRGHVNARSRRKRGQILSVHRPLLLHARSLHTFPADTPGFLSYPPQAGLASPAPIT